MVFIIVTFIFCVLSDAVSSSTSIRYDLPRFSDALAQMAQLSRSSFSQWSELEKVTVQEAVSDKNATLAEYWKFMKCGFSLKENPSSDIGDARYAYIQSFLSERFEGSVLLPQNMGAVLDGMSHIIYAVSAVRFAAGDRMRFDESWLMTRLLNKVERRSANIWLANPRFVMVSICEEKELLLSSIPTQGYNYEDVLVWKATGLFSGFVNTELDLARAVTGEKLPDGPKDHYEACYREYIDVVWNLLHSSACGLPLSQHTQGFLERLLLAVLIAEARAPDPSYSMKGDLSLYVNCLRAVAAMVQSDTRYASLKGCGELFSKDKIPTFAEVFKGRHKAIGNSLSDKASRLSQVDLPNISLKKQLPERELKDLPERWKGMLATGLHACYAYDGRTLISMRGDAKIGGDLAQDYYTSLKSNLIDLFCGRKTSLSRGLLEHILINTLKEDVGKDVVTLNFFWKHDLYTLALSAVKKIGIAPMAMNFCTARLGVLQPFVPVLKDQSFVASALECQSGGHVESKRIRKTTVCVNFRALTQARALYDFLYQGGHLECDDVLVFNKAVFAGVSDLHTLEAGF